VPVIARLSLPQALTGWSAKFTYWDAGFPVTGQASEALDEAALAIDKGIPWLAPGLKITMPSATQF
jgi:hypothetical protein